MFMKMEIKIVLGEKGALSFHLKIGRIIFCEYLAQVSDQLKK